MATIVWGNQSTQGSMVRLGSSAEVRWARHPSYEFTPTVTGRVTLLEVYCLHPLAVGADAFWDVGVYRADNGQIAGSGKVSVTQADTSAAWRSVVVNIPLEAGVTYRLAAISNSPGVLSIQRQNTGVPDHSGFMSGETSLPPIFIETATLDEAYSVRATYFEDGPAISEPSAVNGDGTYAGAGSQLTTTEPTIRHEFSRDNFTTVHGFRDYPVANPTAETFDVDVSAGFEQSIIQGSKQPLAMHSDANWKSRWKYKDDQGGDIYLEFTHNPKAGFVSVPAAKSQYNGQPDSLIHNCQSQMGEFDQLYMPESELGVNFNYSDPAAPMPNYFGGDSEVVNGVVKCAVGLEDDGTGSSFAYLINNTITNEV